MDSDRSGFTLIELLIVVVILGLLAAIAIPKYEATKAKTFITRMTNDLRNLATSEEAYFIDNSTYYGGALPSDILVFTPSTGVTITVNSATATGWSATAASVGTARTCNVFYGDATPLGAATLETRVGCTIN